MRQITFEKYQLIFFLLLFNIVPSVIITIYRKYWYIFIAILASASLVNSINVILLVSRAIINKLTGNESLKTPNNAISKSYSDLLKYIYVVPCYNESREELLNTINSIYKQIVPFNDYKILTVICDGKIKRKPTDVRPRTDEILVNDIFAGKIEHSFQLKDAYGTWTNKWGNLDIHIGTHVDKVSGLSMKFIIIVKDKNMGKRDSLTLIRRLCHFYNNYILQTTGIKNNSDTTNNTTYLNGLRYFSPELIDIAEHLFDDNQNSSTIQNSNYQHKRIPVSYIIGTDADTVLDKYCSYELIKTVKNNNQILGVVGMVDVVKKWNPLVIFQYCEYLYAQCLKRRVQSEITNKVNCLSGCVQLIQVCEETCGNKILKSFNRLPAKDESIFNQIRSYASEDRNHICLMFELFPYVKTAQCLSAISYTNVPTTIMSFLRQRKRWTAGAACNDLLLVTNRRHNKWERLQSAINVMIFGLTIFVVVASVDFLISVIKQPTYLMLGLSTLIFIPALYSISIPLLVYNDGHNCGERWFNIVYYYLGFILYYTFGIVLNMFSYFYTLYYLDDLNWNAKKVQSIIDTNNIRIVQPNEYMLKIKLGGGKLFKFGCIVGEMERDATCCNSVKMSEPSTPVVGEEEFDEVDIDEMWDTSEV